MKSPQIVQQKIYDLSGLLHQIRRWQLLGKTIAFTNGCFDILHRGHIASLSDAAREADYLIAPEFRCVDAETKGRESTGQ
jgi:D-beta-D-heptose 7-phosphate kinase/D-beta-D-heptose 1-phosphate adenosyltransferase